MDTSFNEIQSRIFSFRTYTVFFATSKPDHAGNILCFGNLGDSLIPFGRYNFISKFSPDLDSIRMNIFEHGAFEFDILEKSDFSGYYFFVSGYSPIDNEEILNLDTTFSVINFDSVPYRLHNFCNAKWITPYTFFLTGEKSDLSSYVYIGALVMDTLDNLIHKTFIGNPDTNSWPGLYRTLDFYSPEYTYIAGTFNFGYWSEFAMINSWFFLNQSDSTLNLKWQKFYGGDANYTLYGVLATRDNGCLMWGTKYVWNIQNNERDIYIIKVNKDGLLLSSDGTFSKCVHDVVVYPNPGDDYLIVQSGPQVEGSEFFMLSADGRNVLDCPIHERKMKIDIKSLHSGTYIWYVMFKGKVIESGKWIKE